MEGDAEVSARDALFNDIWDMRSATEKNALIDAFAHELAEQQRAHAEAEAGEPGCWHDGAHSMANLIDPKKGSPR